jgi:hypothetical protein
LPECGSFITGSHYYLKSLEKRDRVTGDFFFGLNNFFILFFSAEEAIEFLFISRLMARAIMLLRAFKRAAFRLAEPGEVFIYFRRTLIRGPGVLLN